jgi:hypothetical protein
METIITKPRYSIGSLVIIKTPKQGDPPTLGIIIDVFNVGLQGKFDYKIKWLTQTYLSQGFYFNENYIRGKEITGTWFVKG